VGFFSGQVHPTLRWTARGLLEAEKKFRRIKGYQEILLLKERLNPSRIQQKEAGQ
jgi:hypothetical protein